MIIKQYCIYEKGAVVHLEKAKEITPLDFVEILCNNFGYDHIILTRVNGVTTLSAQVESAVFVTLSDKEDNAIAKIWVLLYNIWTKLADEKGFDDRAYRVRRMILSTVGLTGEEPQRQIHGMVHSLLFANP